MVAPCGEGDQQRERQPKREIGRGAVQARGQRSLIEDFVIADQNGKRDGEAVGAIAAPVAESERQRQHREDEHRQDEHHALVELRAHGVVGHRGVVVVEIAVEFAEGELAFIVATRAENLVGNAPQGRIDGLEGADHGFRGFRHRR